MRSKKGSIVFANHVPTCNRFFISHDSTSEREKRKSSRQKETVHNNNLKKKKEKKEPRFTRIINYSSGKNELVMYK